MRLRQREYSPSAKSPIRVLGAFQLWNAFCPVASTADQGTCPESPTFGQVGSLNRTSVKFDSFGSSGMFFAVCEHLLDHRLCL
jgi:hypothetical protein